MRSFMSGQPNFILQALLEDLPCDVYELWAESAHALDTVEEVLKTLRDDNMSGRTAQSFTQERLSFRLGGRTCAVRGGKYSNDHQTLSSLVALAIFCVIFMMRKRRENEK